MYAIWFEYSRGNREQYHEETNVWMGEGTENEYYSYKRERDLIAETSFLKSLSIFSSVMGLWRRLMATSFPRHFPRYTLPKEPSPRTCPSVTSEGWMTGVWCAIESPRCVRFIFGTRGRRPLFVTKKKCCLATLHGYWLMTNMQVCWQG